MTSFPPHADAAGSDLAPADSARPEWVTVSRPVDVDDGDRPVRTRRVVIQVVAGALVVLLLVAFSGAIASRRLAEKESVNDAAKIANVLAEAVVQPALTDELLTGDPAAVAAVDAAIRAYVLGTSSVRVKIWTPEGRIVYSDEPVLIGQTFDLGAEERSVFTTPTMKAEVSDLDQPENTFERGQGKLLEVYRPVWTPSGSPLLFETYAPYDDVTSRTGQLWRGFAGVTLSSLVALVVLLLPVLWRLLHSVRRSRAQREALLQKTVDASTDERRRIAGTLHDGVVQELAATSYVVSTAADRAAATGQADMAAKLRDAAGMVRTTIGGLRSLLVDIYPPNLATSGLAAALDDLAASLRLRDVDVVVDLDVVALLRLDQAMEQLIYRVAQECLLNTARHARADTAWVGLHMEGDDVVLDLRDDGIGFDPRLLEDPVEGHFGLRVLGDVASGADARLRLATALGRGTRWQLRVPRARLRALG
jgi:two-component system, NarL family, sensor kinase